MIGAAVPTSVLVLDIYLRNGGSYDSLTQRLGDLPTTLTVWSGRDDGDVYLDYRRPIGTCRGVTCPKAST